jgi:hypothetical protein
MPNSAIIHQMDGSHVQRVLQTRRHGAIAGATYQQIHGQVVEHKQGKSVLELHETYLFTIAYHTDDPDPGRRHESVAV